MDVELPKLTRVSYESRAVCYLQFYRKWPDGTRCGPATATGFYWSNGDKLYLITNWHSVTGLSAATRKPLGSFTPTHLHVWFNEMFDEAEGGGKMVKFVKVELALYDDSELPAWLEHSLGSLVDVVAIPVENYAWKAKIYTVSQKQLSDFSPMCGDDCFIVGYPEGFLGPGGTPIWKRASIATEPELEYDEKPLFLADSPTRAGMSGSPVFARVPGLWGQEGVQLTIGGPSANVLGYLTKFIGVYAGRQGDDREGFQLARVWKSSVLDDIISSGVTPSNPHC